MEKILEAKFIFAKIFSNASVKASGAVVYFLFDYLFDESQHAALSAILILVLIDFMTGIIASAYHKQQIKSAKIFRTALKIVIYFGSISACFLTEKAIGYNLMLDEILVAFLAVTELISVLENMGRLGFALPNKLLNRLDDFRDDKHKKHGQR